MNELLLHKDPANDLDLEVGSTVDVTFQNGATTDLTVAGIYGDSNVRQLAHQPRHAGAGVSDAPARDLFVIAKLADGVDPAAGDAAVEAAMEPFPQANVQTNAEFRDVAGGADQPAAGHHLDTARVRDRHRHPRHLDHARARRVRANEGDRPAPRGRDEQAPDPPIGAVGGDHRVDVRCDHRHRRRNVPRRGAVAGRARRRRSASWRSTRRSSSPSSIGAVIAGFLAALYPSYKASNMNVLEAIATEYRSRCVRHIVYGLQRSDGARPGDLPDEVLDVPAASTTSRR